MLDRKQFVMYCPAVNSSWNIFSVTYIIHVHEYIGVYSIFYIKYMLYMYLLWTIWMFVGNHATVPVSMTLLWRHNDRDGLLNRLFRRRSKKTSKLRVNGLCAGIHWWPVNSPHKGPVTRNMFPFDDVIMEPSLNNMCKWLPEPIGNCELTKPNQTKQHRIHYRIKMYMLFCLRSSKLASDSIPFVQVSQTFANIGDELLHIKTRWFENWNMFLQDKQFVLPWSQSLELSWTL